MQSAHLRPLGCIPPFPDLLNLPVTRRLGNPQVFRFERHPEKPAVDFRLQIAGSGAMERQVFSRLLEWVGYGTNQPACRKTSSAIFAG
jgi:hypothetical protein